MRKVSGYLTEHGDFFETEHECLVEELVGEIIGQYLRKGGGYGIAKDVVERYEIRRKDGAQECGA